jgi:hypothetical protein
MLILIALFGLLVPNGIFVYWLLTDFRGISDFVTNRLALAFIIDAIMAMLLLAYWFRSNPIGKVRWYWFVVLSLLGGLGFSIPFYYWLNRRS